MLTADDLGISKKDIDKAKTGNKEPIPSKRARQNVVFEMGYFMGKLDRAHVFLLLENDVEKPGDLDGINIINFIHNPVSINLSDIQNFVTVTYCNEIFKLGRPDTYLDKEAQSKYLVKYNANVLEMKRCVKCYIIDI